MRLRTTLPLDQATIIVDEALRLARQETMHPLTVVVLDAGGSSITARRAKSAHSIDELLFSLIFLGDDRNIAATYLLGQPATI